MWLRTIDNHLLNSNYVKKISCEKHVASTLIMAYEENGTKHILREIKDGEVRKELNKLEMLVNGKLLNREVR